MPHTLDNNIGLDTFGYVGGSFFKQSLERQKAEENKKKGFKIEKLCNHMIKL
jgi:hypothetical protein